MTFVDESTIQEINTIVNFLLKKSPKGLINRAASAMDAARLKPYWVFTSSTKNDEVKELSVVASNWMRTVWPAKLERLTVSLTHALRVERLLWVRKVARRAPLLP